MNLDLMFMKNINLKDIKIDNNTTTIKSNKSQNDFDKYLSDVDNINKNHKVDKKEEIKKDDKIDKKDIQNQDDNNIQGVDDKKENENIEEFLSNIENLILLLQNIQKIDMTNIEESLKDLDLEGINLDFFYNLENKKILKDIISNDIYDENSIDLSKFDMEVLDKFDEIDLKDIEKLDEIIHKLAKNDDKEYNMTMDLGNDDYDQLENNTFMSRNNIIETKNEDSELSTLESFLDINYNLQVQNTKVEESEVIKAPNFINKEVLNEDVVQTIRYIKSNGIEEIRVKISPRELGDMVIKLTKDNHLNSKVIIELTNKDAYELINRNLGEITKHLADSNIDIKDVVVTINSDDKNLENDNFGSEFERHNQENNKKNKKVNLDDDVFLNTQEELLKEDTLNILA